MDPDKRLSEVFTLRLTPHQVRVLDAVVLHEQQVSGDRRMTAQDLVRDLIREKYRRMVAGGMARVERDD